MTSVHYTVTVCPAVRSHGRGHTLVHPLQGSFEKPPPLSHAKLRELSATFPKHKLGPKFQTGLIVASCPSSSSVWSKRMLVVRPSRDLFSEEVAKLEGARSPTESLLLEILQFEMHFSGLNFCRLLNGFPGWLSSQEFTCNAGDAGSVPGSGRSPRRGNGNPLQYSGLVNPTDQRSLAGCSPNGSEKLDTTEQLNTASQTTECPWGKILAHPFMLLCEQIY